MFGGYIYIDTVGQGSFKWCITQNEDIFSLIEYFKKYPSKSAKNKRLHLIPKLIELKSIEAHLAKPNTILYKSWIIFLDKWNSYE
jgi:hypothetical protein